MLLLLVGTAATVVGATAVVCFAVVATFRKYCFCCSCFC